MVESSFTVRSGSSYGMPSSFYFSQLTAWMDCYRGNGESQSLGAANAGHGVHFEIPAALFHTSVSFGFVDDTFLDVRGSFVDANV